MKDNYDITCDALRDLACEAADKLGARFRVTGIVTCDRFDFYFKKSSDRWGVFVAPKGQDNWVPITSASLESVCAFAKVLPSLVQHLKDVERVRVDVLFEARNRIEDFLKDPQL